MQFQTACPGESTHQPFQQNLFLLFTLLYSLCRLHSIVCLEVFSWGLFSPGQLWIFKHSFMIEYNKFFFYHTNKKLKRFFNKFSQMKQVPPFSGVTKWSPLKKACKNCFFFSSHLLKSTIRQFYTFRSARMTYLLQNLIHTHIHFEKLSIPQKIFP